MIKLQVIGNLGKDCVQNEVNGKTVLNFNVAHSERFKDAQGNLVERTTWVNCAYWTDRTGVAPYLVKGQQVYVEGTPDVEIYTNKEGQTAATLRMRVFSLQLVGNKGDVPNAQPSQPVSQSRPASANTESSPSMQNTVNEPVDDLPF